MADTPKRSRLTPEQHRRLARLYRENPESDPNSAALADFHEKLALAFEREGYTLGSSYTRKREP